MGFVCTLSSGSSGNAALFSHGNTHILVDMGITCRRLNEQLSVLGMNVGSLSAVVVTHAHSDHVSGLSVLCRKTGIPVYASYGASGLLGRAGILPDTLRVYDGGFDVGGVCIEPFATPHDSPGSAGYVLHMGSFSAAVATDMGFMPHSVLEKLTSADYVLLESNHDIDMLRYGSYPAMLKRRILGTEGHLSNDEAAAAVTACVKAGTRRITLCHLSEDNNSPDLALGTAAHALYENGLDCVLDVAPRFTCGEPEYFGDEAAVGAC